MKYISLIIFSLTLLLPACSSSESASGESTRKERTSIMRGNKQYKDHKFAEAASSYEDALKENGNSAEARYNLGLAQVRQAPNPNDSTPAARDLRSRAQNNFSNVASLAKTKPGLAAKANYNLGNMAFNAKDYQQAISYYKQSLRIDPNDEFARKNLRIAQKNLKNQDQNKDNQDQNQDQNKDQNKEENKDQNQNQNQNQDKNKEDQKQEQSQDKNISKQSADRILQAVDNKESQTRARVNKANTGKDSAGRGHNIKRW